MNHEQFGKCAGQGLRLESRRPSVVMCAPIDDDWMVSTPIGRASRLSQFRVRQKDDFEDHTNSWIERWTRDDEIAGTRRSS